MLRALSAGLRLLAVLMATFGCGKTAGDLSGVSGPSECKPPSMLCSKSCTNIATDPDHCGACEAACPAGDQCVRGACSSTACPAGQTDCGGLCTDLKTNPLNCGSCNTACAPAERCVRGACECTGTAQMCGGTCTDVGSSDRNCGACGHECSISETCKEGTCQARCVPGQLVCDSQCMDVTSNPATCGDCDTSCKPAESCVGGRCRCPNDARHAICNGVCADLSSDNNNCGKCGNPCSAGTHCNESVCAACFPGLFFCPSVGGDPLAACLAQAGTAQPPAGADEGGPPPLSPDAACQCQHCLVELTDCVADQDCVSAYQCATTKGCTDHCFDTMGVCSMSGGSVGGCWKFCPPTTGPSQGATHAEALLRCTSSNGCGI